jgi:hypothetical protein
VIPWKDIDAYRANPTEAGISNAPTATPAPSRPHAAAYPQDVQITDGPRGNRPAPPAPPPTPAVANPNERD